MTRHPLALLLWWGLLLLGTQPALAQETFSFQGRLTTPDGTPVTDGSHAVRFQLFDDATGGSPRWGEAHAVTTEGGIFSVVLGTKTTLRLDAFEAMPYLLLIVDNEAMEPRIPLTAVPYAMKSYRLDEEALRAGQNVSINRLSDGTLQIGSTGGGGTGGLTSVATDGTITGNGTSGAPLGIADGSVTGSKLSNGALVAGANVGIVRRGNGSLEISAADGGGGGLTQVATGATLTGDGTTGSPLQLADGAVIEQKLGAGSVSTAKMQDGVITTAKMADQAVTGAKVADGALVAGSNVTITRQAGGALQVASVGGGGLSQVATGATLTGDGTAGSPIQVAVPLVLTGSDDDGVVYGEHANGNNGWLGSIDSGIFGYSYSDIGVKGTSDVGTGVRGNSFTSYGVLGTSHSNYGVLGRSLSSFGVYGENGSNWGALGTSNFGGAFNGDVIVLGNLAKSSGSFKIDHPLDPANKYLSHSFVESPDMMNVYNGNVITDANGEATVTLPDYFEALNRDFRYQLTTIGGFAPVYIDEKITGNQFKIAGGKPGMEVSWQVTGIRQDAWAEQNRIVVEEDKPAKERGFYLHPALFGQPEERSLMWARDPEMRRELQEASRASRSPEQQ